MNAGAVPLQPGLGAQGRVVNAALATRSVGLGVRARDLSFFGFNPLHADVRDVVAVAE